MLEVLRREAEALIGQKEADEAVENEKPASRRAKEPSTLNLTNNKNGAGEHKSPNSPLTGPHPPRTARFARAAEHGRLHCSRAH